MSRAMLVLGVLAMLGAAGCGHTETHAAMLRPAAPPPSRPVAMYMLGQPAPERPQYEIAIVQAIGFGRDANPEDVTRALSDEAQHLGCDAVVRVSVDVGYTRAHATGLCVRYLGPAEGEEPAPGPSARASGPSPAPPVRLAPSPRMEPLPSAPPGGGPR